MRDDVAWDAWRAPSAARARVSWLVEQHGKDGVQAFFGALGSALELTDFQVVSLMSGAGKVAAEIEFDAMVRANGNSVHVEELHMWSFDDEGRVAAYRDYFDTAEDIEALEGHAAAVP
ncbi:MAG TPA: nuclear transport factor 2 family protein [Nocardioidaceae bacterium]|nr:nuclear transport factor 2 family protein [Nocardioidaceae bacterium]